MSVTTAIRPASQAQVNFINSLRSQRSLDALSLDELRVLDTRDASREIDRLKALPITQGPRVQAGAGYLEGLPLSKYALVDGEGVATFYEVKRYKETVYLRLLVGAPGEFRRIRLPYGEAHAVAARIRVDPLAAAQAFARTYTVCGVCCADLSDPESVRLGLGPICRGRFGL